MRRLQYIGQTPHRELGDLFLGFLGLALEEGVEAPLHGQGQQLASIALLAQVLLAGCATGPEDRLREAAPLLPDRSIKVLADGSYEELRDWYLDRGEAELQWDFLYVARRLEFGTPEARAFLQPILERLGRVVDEDFFIGYASYLPRYLAQLDGAPAPVAVSVDRIFPMADAGDDAPLWFMASPRAIACATGRPGVSASVGLPWRCRAG